MEKPIFVTVLKLSRSAVCNPLCVLGFNVAVDKQADYRDNRDGVRPAPSGKSLPHKNMADDCAIQKYR